MQTQIPTGLALYQPLIVGLGAVALGFIANALLEMWKEHLRKNAAANDLRKACYYESLVIRDWAQNSCDVLEAGGNFIYYKSKFLDEISPQSLSALNLEEIEKFKSLVSSHDVIMSWIEFEDTHHAPKLVAIEDVKDESRESLQDRLSNIVDAADKLTKVLRRYI